VAPPGNQAVNRENKCQPAGSGETALLNSNLSKSNVKKVLENHKNYIEERLIKVDVQVRYLSPEKYAAGLRSQNDYFEKAIKGIKE
jgi:hypothetical protein